MILALDIGGTQIKTGLFNNKGEIIELSKFETNIKDDDFSMLDRISEILDLILEKTI